MADETKEKRKKNLLAAMEKERGYMLGPSWALNESVNLEWLFTPFSDGPVNQFPLAFYGRKRRFA